MRPRLDGHVPGGGRQGSETGVGSLRNTAGFRGILYTSISCTSNAEAAIFRCLLWGTQQVKRFKSISSQREFTKYLLSADHPLGAVLGAREMAWPKLDLKGTGSPREPPVRWRGHGNPPSQLQRPSSQIGSHSAGSFRWTRFNPRHKYVNVPKVHGQM